MKLTPPLQPATLCRRYKRFLADVRLPNGESLTVHTPNTGSMLGLSEPGTPIWLRDTNNPARKYRYSWEMSEPEPGLFVGVHTGIVNQLVKEAIEVGIVTELQHYDRIQQEVAYGVEKSRIDLLLSAAGKQDCFVEIKNVTAADDAGLAIFPDAVTTRGQKHLRELRQVVRDGGRAVIFFCVQRNDIQGFRAAQEIDPDYARLLEEVVVDGVEVLAYKARISPDEISLTEAVPVALTS